MAMNENNRFYGEIKVASRIVDYLSSGLYESPAACLKELINNSYDADAKNVNIFVKPDADRIIIEDDGEGMNKQEFQKHFDLIAQSHKRDESDHTPSGRPKIGKIGIGFIAANEICDVMEIHSTKRGSNELLQVNIDFSKMREDPVTRRRDGEELAKGDYEGVVTTTDPDDHYTYVFLKQVRGDARNILASAKRNISSTGIQSLYGLSDKSIAEILGSESLTTWDKLDPYSENLLKVALSIPVKYYDSWLPEKLRSKVKWFETKLRKLDFSVKYDGSELRQPIILGHSAKRSIIKTFDFKGNNVSAQGYFFAQHNALKPQDLNGLLVRIRHAAIGSFDKSFMDFPTTIGTLFQRWISAEIWADDRLEDALNIDRKTLRTSHPAYVELQKAVHDFLSEFLGEVRRNLYQTGNIARRREQAKKTLVSLQSITKEEIAPISRETAKLIASEWGTYHDDAPAEFEKKLLKKYTVLDIYSIVVEVAKDVLDKRQFQQFFKKLTERLKS